MMINHPRPVKRSTIQAFAHLLFEIIRRGSNTTPLEGPNILISFLNAGISRYPASGEENKRYNLKASLRVTKTSINFAQLIVNLTYVGRPRKGSRSFLNN